MTKADLLALAERVEAATEAAKVAEVCAVLASRYDAKGNAQSANYQPATAHRISAAYEQHLVAIRQSLAALTAASLRALTPSPKEQQP